MLALDDTFHKNVYLRLLVRFMFVCVTVVLLDLIAGSLLKKFYFSQESGLEYRTTYSIDKTKADVLIFGSSTANHNYVPSIIQDGLKMSVYNVGRDGISVFYDFAVLKCVLKRYRPKMIILDFDESEFRRDEQSYDRLSCLLPYYKNHPEIRPIVDMKSPYEKFKMASHIYPYNSLLFTISAGNAEFNKRRRGDLNGYVPLNTVWQEPIRDGNTFTNYPVDSNKIRIFELFLKECANAKVPLSVISSPLFIRSNYRNNSIELGQALCQRYDVKFLDCSKDSFLINKPELFADISHLNDEGAAVFSRRIVDQLLAGKNSLRLTAQRRARQQEVPDASLVRRATQKSD